MPIEVKCPTCETRFRVPEKYAGKRAKCPKCQGAIEIPAPGEPAAEQPAPAKPAPKTQPQRKGAPKRPAPAKPAAEQWYVQTEDGEQYGPVSREELNDWVAEARIDASCQLLREGWQQWKWTEDVFPELAESPAEPAQAPIEENPFAQIGDPGAETSPAPAAVVPPVPFPPRSPGAVDRGQAVGGGGVDASRMRRTLAEILRPWLTFVAVMGFIGGAFATYVLVRLLILLFKAMSQASKLGEEVPWQVVVFVIEVFAALGAVVLYVIAAYFLLAFQQRMDAFLRRDQSRELNRAMVVYRQFWLFVFIATGIMVGVYLITIIMLETLPK